MPKSSPRRNFIPALACGNHLFAGAVLLNADIDHVLGLLLLRELQPLCVFATESIRRILTEDNSMFAMLQRVPEQVRWIDFVPATWFSLTDPAGHDSKVQVPRSVCWASTFLPTCLQQNAGSFPAAKLRWDC